MNLLNKKQKEQKQLKIDQMDDMFWRSTPLGKFLSSIKETTPNSHAQDLQNPQIKNDPGS